MKKVLLGFLLMGFIASASVSFASDGPKTTKECVIDNADVMETLVIVDEFNEVYTISSVSHESFDELFLEAEKSFDNDVGYEAIELIHSDIKLLAETGIYRRTYRPINSKLKTNTKPYKFTSKGNPIRML